MDASARLALPFTAPQQAQRHLTFNELVRALDLLVQPAVLSRTSATPPGSPADGDSYIVGTGASGAWAGKDGQFACFVDGGWDFRMPADGWLAYVADTTEIAIRKAGAWTTLVTNGGSGVASLGINASADLTNRLTVAAAATLFNHDGSDHRLKINKSASGHTASLLYQQGFTGHAEFGLAGDNDLHLKVSPNGSTWYEAMTIARASGAIALPIGQLVFPATQNPSSNPNTLDDYEEGTWTPGITFSGGSAGLTYASRSGVYTKVGRLVNVGWFIELSAKGSSTGSALITGLPFAVTSWLNGGSLGYYSGMTGLGGSPIVQGRSGETAISLWNPGAAAVASVTHANLTDSTYLYGSVTYAAA